MKLYAVIIETTDPVELKLKIAKYWKSQFISEECMISFLDGYLLGNYMLKNIQQFEHILNATGLNMANRFVKFVSVINKEEE